MRFGLGLRCGGPKMSERKLISSGSSFEKLAGFSRAVVDGDWVFVSGTTGYDYSTMTISPDLEAQTRQTFANISAALAQAGCTLDDVVRVHYYLTDQVVLREGRADLRRVLQERAAGRDRARLRAGDAGDEDRDRGDGATPRRGGRRTRGAGRPIRRARVSLRGVATWPARSSSTSTSPRPTATSAPTRISALAAKHGRSVHLEADPAGRRVQGDRQRPVADACRSRATTPCATCRAPRASTVFRSSMPERCSRSPRRRRRAPSTGCRSRRRRRSRPLVLRAVPRLLRGRQGHLQPGDHGRRAGDARHRRRMRSLAALNDPAIKERLKTRPRSAIERGVFGSPYGVRGRGAVLGHGPLRSGRPLAQPGRVLNDGARREIP